MCPRGLEARVCTREGDGLHKTNRRLWTTRRMQNERGANLNFNNRPEREIARRNCNSKKALHSVRPSLEIDLPLWKNNAAAYLSPSQRYAAYAFPRRELRESTPFF